MPVKIARSTPQPSFGLPELLVASHISRLASRDAAKSLLSTLISESSGECRFKCIQRAIDIRHARNADCAVEAAELRYERLHRVHNWTLYADFLGLEVDGKQEGRLLPVGCEAPAMELMSGDARWFATSMLFVNRRHSAASSGWSLAG